MWIVGKSSREIVNSDEDSGNEDAYDGLNADMMKTMKREWQSAAMMRTSNKLATCQQHLSINSQADGCLYWRNLFIDTVGMMTICMER